MRSCTLLPLLIMALTAAAATQSTVPHWSTCFGGTGREEVSAIRRGPGNLVTLVGHTTSIGLATPGVFQTAIVGAPATADAFVARFDPSLPPAQQLLWCTYVGGSDMELVFDAEVDPVTGITTLVGLTRSPDFPAASGQQPPTLPGPGGLSDGFVAQVAADGRTLLFSQLLGGPQADHLCEVEPDAGGALVLAGTTEGGGLQNATNAFVPPHDAFVARMVPVSPGPVLWSTYVGGPSTEGLRFSLWPGFSQYEGNLDRMALTLDTNGDPVLATVSFTTNPPAWTSPGALRPTGAGLGDWYLAVLNVATGARIRATYLGGSGDDRPKAIVSHPLGGFVVSGNTDSANQTVTSGCLQGALQGGTDGFVAWIDAGLSSLLYSSYLGGNAGEDVVHAIALETSGLVTLVGHTAGGSFPTTPRCLQGASGPSQVYGFVARLELGNLGSRDLLHSTFVGPLAMNTLTVWTRLLLDEVGDVYAAGATNSPSYPVVNGQGPAGGRDAVLTHLPLLPGGQPGACVMRQQIALAVPACGMLPLYTGMAGAPVPGTTFGITATNAPPGSLGVLALGLSVPPVQLLPPFNGWLLAQPFATVVRISGPLGFARHDLSVPAALPAVPCWGLGAQWLFLTNTSCPGTGLLGTSERLDF